jgi:restriction system protein
MKKYYRVFLGQGSKHADQALQEGWVGTGWLSHVDLTEQFPDNLQNFNAAFIPEVMKHDEVSSRIGAGLACGKTWTLGHEVCEGDVVVSSDANGVFHLGTVTSPYFYSPDQPLPHRRSVQWDTEPFERADFSEDMRRSLGSGNTVANLSAHADEIERAFTGDHQAIIVNDSTVENPLSFVLERHLEDFLVSNWEHTDLGKKYDIFVQDGEIAGRQFPTDTGPIDILAQSKDGKELVVIELKRGRVSDVVVGQILRYMGYVTELDDSKTVKGIIIGADDDPKFRRALAMVPTVEFYKYEVSFKLSKS